MTIYEINERVNEITNHVEYNAEVNAYVNMETGEITTIEEMMEELNQLDMEKHNILEWLVKQILNYKAEAQAIKAEEQRLKARREKFEKKADYFTQIVDRECAGEKMEFDVATVSYRKSKAVVYDESKYAYILDWLVKNNHTECIKDIDPEIRKTELKKLMETEEVPFVRIEERVNMSIR